MCHKTAREVSRYENVTMTNYWWVAPVLSLVGALLGGMLASWVSGLLAERRAERSLVREARIAVERWYATRVGPMNIYYPGVDPRILREISDELIKEFFNRHFEETVQAKSALGAVRHLDGVLGDIVDLQQWKLPEDRIDEIRSGLMRAETHAWKGTRAESKK